MGALVLRIVLTSLLICLATTLAAEPDARILVMGDSMMASNRFEGQSVGDFVQAETSLPVQDRSVVGARYFYYLPLSGATGLRLPAQYHKGDWDWVVLNGGGNDLLFGCGCGDCKRMMNRLISTDGKTGAIPELVATLRAGGAKVIYTGYLRNPGTSTPIKSCKPAGDELDRRLAAMASLDQGVQFLSLADLVPYGDTSYHGIDRVHPSPKGSRAIGARISRLIAP